MLEQLAHQERKAACRQLCDIVHLTCCGEGALDPVHSAELRSKLGLDGKRLRPLQPLSVLGTDRCDAAHSAVAYCSSLPDFIVSTKPSGQQHDNEAKTAEPYRPLLMRIILTSEPA